MANVRTFGVCNVNDGMNEMQVLFPNLLSYVIFAMLQYWGVTNLVVLEQVIG